MKCDYLHTFLMCSVRLPHYFVKKINDTYVCGPQVIDCYRMVDHYHLHRSLKAVVILIHRPLAMTSSLLEILSLSSGATLRR